MKRLTVSFFLILSLLFSGCTVSKIGLFGKNAFPEGTSAFGLDLSGLNAEEAQETLQSCLTSYVLTVSTEDCDIPLTGESVGLLLDDTDYETLIAQCEELELTDVSGRISLSLDEELLSRAVSGKLGDYACDTGNRIIFDEEKGRFVVEEYLSQDNTISESKLEQIRTAFLALEPKLTLLSGTESNQQLRAEVEKANTLLGIVLTYQYSPLHGEPATEIINQDQLSQWLKVSEDGQTVELDKTAISDYVTAMDTAHTLLDSYTEFLTSNGEYVDINIPLPGQKVDAAALYEDIMTCLSQGISAQREAPYEQNGDNGLTYGGTYVEVDLDNQHMWFYVDGELIVESDCVTGCCNEGHATPKGVYTIYEKATDTELVGEDYRSHVDYWMAFNGGIGLHDATWRGSFGGTIYYYFGSHGCVNLPYDVAKTLYEYTEVGTHVIVYGTIFHVANLDNTLSGTQSYTLETGQSVTLDAAPGHKAELKYSSSNSSVAAVDSSGVVTAKNAGTAVITVKTEEVTGYNSVSMSVSITVKGSCNGNHTWGDGTVIREPTCTQEGEKQYTCSVCGEKKTESIAKSAHNWVPVKTEPTCGSEGKVEGYCSVCGAAMEPEIIPATGDHQYSNGYCTVCGAPDPDYTAPAEEPGDGDAVG